MFISLSFICVGCTLFTAHSNKKDSVLNSVELPILSPKVNGEHTPIGSFQLVSQYNKTISNQDVKGKVYVAEFFFTSCPSICPLVSKQLKRVFERYKNEPNFMILSHTINPKHDTVSRLKEYYKEKLGIQHPSNWNLLTGDQNEIYDLANFSYGAVVYEEKTKLKDNIMHSGALLLVDQCGFIRGMYDGKDSDNTERLIKDIQLLLK